MSDIARAAEILRAGGLVALPTETVYGLGADATNAEAVARIFAAKGRPAANPLIVHVANIATARRYCTAWPENAQKLAERFWPGPLTLVLPKSAEIPHNVTAGHPTVGMRVPDHQVALALLQAFDGPIAAPSANRSNQISPTTAQHVGEELGDSVDLILDGGPCSVGIESTVLDLSAAVPTILRPGGVSRERIEAVIGPVRVQSGSVDVASAASSPGQQAVHYAPRAPAFYFAHDQVSKIPASNAILRLDRSPGHYAQAFYARLRELDSKTPPAIYIELPPDQPEWAAIRDRIMRGARAFSASR